MVNDWIFTSAKLFLSTVCSTLQFLTFSSVNFVIHRIPCTVCYLALWNHILCLFVVNLFHSYIFSSCFGLSFVIHSSMSVSSKHLFIPKATLSWMEVNFLNQYPCTPLWSGDLQFGTFLRVALVESRCIFAFVLLRV